MLTNPLPNGAQEEALGNEFASGYALAKLLESVAIFFMPRHEEGRKLTATNLTL